MSAEELRAETRRIVAASEAQRLRQTEMLKHLETKVQRAEAACQRDDEQPSERNAVTFG